MYVEPCQNDRRRFLSEKAQNDSCSKRIDFRASKMPRNYFIRPGTHGLGERREDIMQMSKENNRFQRHLEYCYIFETS